MIALLSATIAAVKVTSPESAQIHPELVVAVAAAVAATMIVVETATLLADPGPDLALILALIADLARQGEPGHLRGLGPHKGPLVPGLQHQLAIVLLLLLSKARAAILLV